MVDEVNTGLRGEIVSALEFERELTLVRERAVRVVLQPVLVGRQLKVDWVDSVESVVGVSCVVSLSLLGGWTATSNTDSQVTSIQCDINFGQSLI